MIGEAEAAGRGLAHEATDVLIRYATTTLGIHEIELEVFADNGPAIAIYSAWGFRPWERRGSLLHMVRRA